MCDRQFGEVMSLVIRVINFIVARALNDRQFKTLLDEVNNYPGLLLHSNVRWLSRGKVLSRFAACLNEIRTFLEMKGVGHPELADTEWLLKFYYLVDLTEHLNQLNVKMQGIGNTVLSLQQAVFAFENKLELFITDLETGRLLHFEKLSQFKDACTASEPIQNLDLHQLAGCTSSLLQSFKARFGEFREHTRLFKFITHPNECSLNTADLNYIPGVSVRDFEAEVADLKASDMWVNKFKSLNEDLERITRQKAELASKHMWTEMKKLQPEDQLILKTWNALPVTYHTLQRREVKDAALAEQVLMETEGSAVMEEGGVTSEPPVNHGDYMKRNTVYQRVTRLLLCVQLQLLQRSTLLETCYGAQEGKWKAKTTLVSVLRAYLVKKHSPPSDPGLMSDLPVTM
ncbi:hypothetical protein NHX12_033380 [Muraenolepis orangiensis]|uniref:General transcription factor II-I repeat domain-containing protein 2A n=1 Tax=Muraenolepis orangiensis TaxID=630683 RepID=A0A9Q0E7I3_9TELE|nr:hypothetical protein NHX12_033380 [Muraenolepis orangiensis]